MGLAQPQNPSPLVPSGSSYYNNYVYMPLTQVGDSSNGSVTLASLITQPITITDIQVVGELNQAGFLMTVGVNANCVAPVKPTTLPVGTLVPFDCILLNHPQALMSGANGQIIIADTGDNVILLYDSRIKQAMVIADLTAGLNGPMVLSRDAVANVLIGDTGNNRILQLNWLWYSPWPTGGLGPGGIQLVAGNGSACNDPTDPCGDGGLATAARLGTVLGLAHSRVNTDLFMADTNNCRIRRVDGNDLHIYPYAGDKKCEYTGDGGDPANAGLNNPQGMTMDTFGNLFIADTGNNVVRRVDAVTGKISTFAGNGTSVYAQDFVPATQTGLPGPTYVTIDYKGNVFITCSDDTIRKVDAATGYISTFAGTGQGGYNGDTIAALTQLSGPAGVTTDGKGLYLADAGNNLLRHVDTVTEDSRFEFTAATDCIGTVLQPLMNTCNVGLTFSPAVPAVQHAQVVVTETHSDAMGNPGTYSLSVPLNGLGAFTWARVSAADVTIPETPAGQTSNYVRVLFTNSGSVGMIFQGVSIINDPNNYFSEVDNCTPGNVQYTGNCLVDVNFNAPVTPGTYTAQLQFVSNALNGTQFVNLTASSAAQQATSIAWTTPAAINYGTLLSATQLNAVVTPSNAPGTVAYSIGAASVGIGSVIPAGAQTVTATFTPTDPLQYAPAITQVTIQVNQVPLTITPNNVSIKVTDSIPTLTGTIAGIANPKDQFNVSYTTTGVAGQVGVYPINAAPGGGQILSQPPWSNYNPVTFNTGTLTIGNPLPDLQETTLSIPPSISAGTSLVVGDTTANKGIGSAGSTSTAFYLSTSSTSNNRWMFMGNRTITSLAVNATSVGSTTLTFPANVTGTYYFYACANAYSSVPESNSANNCMSQKVTLTSGVNLILFGLSYTPSTLTAPGQTIQVFDTTQNVGTATAPTTSSTAYYLSTTGTNKWMYLGNRTVPALAAGASSATTPSTAPLFTLPTYIHGKYYLLACANAYNTVNESSTSDNCQNVTITLP